MGNDGALALRRKDIVKDKTESKDGAKESKQVTEADRWTKCSLSGEKLEEPIVSDEFGRLYNKEAVLEWLLSGEENPSMKHVTSIKDVADLRLEWKDGRWVCPISNKDVLKEFGSGKFMYFAECGHITAESALKNVLSDMCLQCEEPVNVDYAVVINPQPTDMRKLEVRMEKLAADGLTHSLRKMKRKKESKSKDSSSSKRKKRDELNIYRKCVSDGHSYSDLLSSFRSCRCCWTWARSCSTRCSREDWRLAYRVMPIPPAR